MMNLIKDVVILGGGSSAWLTAALLSYQKPNFSITVIDKEVGTPVGVGEGTILDFEPYLNLCGFKKEEWFNEIDATNKSGILFPGWGTKKNIVWHPFLTHKMSLNYWSQNQKQINFKDQVIGSTDNIKQGAYHIDCSKLVEFIKNKISKKIKLIQSEMIESKSFNNKIKYLKLKNGQVIKGDLFIDCTGFKSLLNKKPKRNNLKNRLICNTAIAGHISYKDKQKELKPYVTSEAVDYGWIWNIPVQSRIGSGIVFNRDITKVEEAKNYFIKYWNNRIDESKLKVIDWTPFYNDDMWKENVVSIGLSAGFIEPLESTGLALIMRGAFHLLLRIDSNYYDDSDIKIFNNNIKHSFEECIDFVNMHYNKINRNEKFWKIAKQEIKVSEKLKFYSDYLKSKTLSLDYFSNHTLQNLDIFSGNNWILWLVQMGYKVTPRDIRTYK